MTIDLSKMSVLELKGFAYDQLRNQEILLANLRAANELIAQKEQEQQAAIHAKHKELDAAALDAKLATEHKPE